MMNLFKNGIQLISLAVLVSLMSGCMCAPVRGDSTGGRKPADGTFSASFKHGLNKAVAEVTTKNGRIEHIKLPKHTCSWKGKRADKIIPERIIEKQSTDVDAVTGATNSSRVIMNAVQKALEKAYAAK